MKKLFFRLSIILLIAFITSVSAFADPVGLSKARAIAQSILQNKSLSLVDGVNTGQRRIPSLNINNPAYFVFNAENNGGFAIISGDDAVGSVLGYSDTGSFDLNDMHPALKEYLDFCAQYIKDVEAGVVSAPKRASETPGTIIVAPMCTSKWGQKFPFNMYTPDNCPCGCTATAISQIMRYWQWPNIGRGSVAYSTTYYNVLSKDFSTSTYHWEIMLDEGTIRKPKASKAMGLLTYDVGLSVAMDYSPDGSGATDENARTSLPKYFKYKASTIDLRRRMCYSTQKEWMDLVKNELVNNRPVFYAGHDSIAGGHAFVIDGFDSNDFVHVNWGWNGVSNGYYNIITLAPDSSDYAFSLYQSMIIGIEPDHTEQDTQVGQYRLFMEKSPECEGTQTLGLPFNMVYRNIMNLGYDRHIYTLGVGLYDADANFIAEISTPSKLLDYSYTQQFNPGEGGYSKFTIAAKLDSLTADGKYALRCVFREEGYSDWMLPDMYGGTELNWIPIVVKNGKVYLDSTDGPEYPTAIESVHADNSPNDSPYIINKEYYDLQGRKLSPNAVKYSKHSAIIEQQHLSNGKVIIRKIF